MPERAQDPEREMPGSRLEYPETIRQSTSMAVRIKEEVVCPIGEDPFSLIPLKNKGAFTEDSLAALDLPEGMPEKDWEFEYECRSLSISMQAQNLCAALKRIEKIPAIESVMRDLDASTHRILVATVSPAHPYGARWEHATHVNLELTGSGFRVRDGRLIEFDGAIIRQFVEYNHRFDRLLKRHLLPRDLEAFANAGVTEKAILLNLKAQLFEILPPEVFRSTFLVSGG